MTDGLRVMLVGPYPREVGKIVGGVQAVTTTLAPALAAREEIAQVSVVCFHAGQTRPHRVTVNDKLQVWYLRGQRHFALPTRSMLQVLQARSVAARLWPDVVHGQGISTNGDAAIRLSDAAVVTVHGLVHKERCLASRGRPQDWFRTAAVDAMVRRVLRRARVVISTSQYDAVALAGLVSGSQVCIPNPVASEFFSNPDYSSGEKRVLFAGQLVQRKNVVGLLRSFARVHRRVPDACLAIVGPSPSHEYAQQVHDTIGQLGLGDSVDLLGHVEHEELLRQIGASRCVVLFSDEETLPTIIAQAMAAAKPVVASRVGGVPEMVADGETGLLVDPGDEPSLADRLAALLESPGWCADMGTLGREIARQRFEPGAVAQQTVAAYRLLREQLAGHE